MIYCGIYILTRAMLVKVLHILRIAHFSSRAKICLFIISLLFIFFVYKSFSSCQNHLMNPIFLQEDKCPACFGNSFCRELHSGNITIDNQPDLITYFRGFKDIILAKRNDFSRLILKRLAFDNDFEALDSDFCLATSQSKSCDISKYIYLSDFAERDLQLKTYTGLSDMVHCPSRRLLVKILDNYREKRNARELFVEDRLHLGYTLSVNQEPILMQTFPREDGWPFPRYLGACGRVIVVEYVGKTLSNYLDSPWEEKIDFAYQLLKMAEKLTNNNQGYNLYMTDVAFDNFAVNKDGKVILIDLENVVVVDQSHIKREQKPHWKEPIESPFDLCPHSVPCLTFSHELMCSRLHLDHNYYAVCRNLLSKYASVALKNGGFLKGLPEEIEQRYDIFGMIELCARPLEIRGRMKVIPRLLSALEDIRRDYL